MPKISVVIPVYNAEPFLRQCLDSVVGQSFRDIEIICVDDGSTDASPEILREYQKRDPRIVVLTQKNQYAGVARNKGMDIAQGKYIVFWDADDYFDPNALAVLYDRAEETQADVVICESRVFDQENKEVMEYNPLSNSFSVPEKEVFSWRDVGQKIFSFNGAPWDKLYQLDFVRKSALSFETFRCLEDFHFVFEALLAADRITYLSDRLVTYRKYGHASLVSTVNKNIDSVFAMIDSLQNVLKKRDLEGELRQAFDNFIFGQIVVWISFTLDSFAVYKQFFYKAQKQIIGKYRLTDRPEEYFFSPDWYVYLQNMVHLDPEECLLRNMRVKWEYADRLNSYLLHTNHICQEQADILREQADILREHENTISSLGQIVSVFEERKHWVYPYEKLPCCSGLALYGAGDVGSDFYRQFQNTKGCHVTLWVDREFEKYRADGLPVDCPAALLDGGWDHVVIAVLRQKTAETIRRDLVAMGIPEEKILWEDLLVGREDHDTF